jgi:uncharacterized protein
MPSHRERPRAVITGASAGIGTAYAERLARAGYDVVLVARRPERLEALAARLGVETGVRAEAFVADLTDPRARADVEARLAGDDALALLVNNAGFGAYGAFADIDPAAIDALIDIHVRAVARLTRAALPGMIRRRAGAVINVASLLALAGDAPPYPLPYRTTYAGAKAFMVAFTQALSGELAGTGVAVQACLPGLVATEFHTVQGMDMSVRPRMSAADVVTASLAALGQGEVLCVPTLDDASLLGRLADAQRAVLATSAPAKLAARYRGTPR